MNRPFSIYKHHTKHRPEVWHLHRSYSTVGAAIDSLRDLTKRSAKSRVWRYSMFPTIKGMPRVFEADEYLNKMLTETMK